MKRAGPIGRRITVAAAAAGAVALAAALGAIAFWTTGGTGTASASVATLEDMTVTATSPSPGTAHVAWTSLSSPNGPTFDTEVEFTVERKSSAGSTWTFVCGTGVARKASSELSCDDSPAVTEDYDYRVTAYFRSWTSPDTDSVHVVVDSTPPTVSSITRDDANPTNAATVRWTVSFSEDVTGVTAADLALVGPGSSGAGITLVTGSGDQYQVTADTGGVGVLGLNVVDDDSIEDLAANKLGGIGTGNGDFTGETYDVDRAAPTVNSIMRDDPSPTNAGMVAWTVTFSENVTGVGADDFAVTTVALTGTPSVQSVTPITATTYTVTSTTGTGTSSASATLRLDVADDDSIADGFGNPLGGAGAGNGDFTAGQVYTVDKTSPTVTVEQKSSQADPTNVVPIRFTVTFSEPVTGFDDATDLTRIGTTAGGSLDVTGSGADYEIVISDPPTTLTNGTLGFTVAAARAVDAAGNGNTSSTSGDNLVTYDTVAPVVTLAATGSANGAGWRTAPFTVSASATDSLSGVAGCQANVTYSGPDTGTGSISRNCTDNAGNVGSASFTFKYDATAPTVTLAASPASPNGTNGWYKSAVTWMPSQTDATSGPASCEPAVVYGGPDSATASVTRTCADVAGNVGSASAIFKYDATAPTVTLTPSPASPNGSNGWYRSAVTWTPSQTDATSGAASCEATVVYSGPDSAIASVTRTCTDNAGNVGSNAATFKYDGTSPTGTVTAPENGASVSGSAVSVASTTAADPASGVASVQFQVKPGAGSFANLGAADSSAPYGTSWDTTAIANGSYILQAIITDNAGNQTTTEQITVTVANVYTFVIGTIANQTAGTAFGGFTIQLQLNGSNSTTFNGATYTGSKTISYSGTAAASSPSGANATASSTVSFTDGLATVPAAAITLVRAATSVVLTLTDSTSSPSIVGNSNTFNVAASTSTALWYVTTSAGTTRACATGSVAVGNGGTLTVFVAVIDSLGNLTANGASVRTVTLTRTPISGGGNAPNPASLTIAASANPAVTSGASSFTIPSGNPPDTTYAAASAGLTGVSCIVKKN